MAQITVQDALGVNQTAARVVNTGAADAVDSLPVTMSNDVSLLGPAALSTLNDDLLTGVNNGWYDCGSFQSGSIQVIASAGISAGAVFFEQTNETSLAPAGVPLRAYEASSVSLNPNVAAVTIAASTARVFTVPINSRYIRVRISTAFVGGTVRAAATFSQRPSSFPVVNVQQATAANLNATAVGNAAVGATAGVNPVQTAGVANTAQPTARTAGQIVAPLYSKVGHSITMANQIRDLRDLNPMVTLTTTAETTIVTAVAATFNDLEDLIVCNTATFTGTPTAARLDIRDVTAGTVRFSVPIPLTPSNPIPPLNFPAPMKQTTVNTAWTAQLVFVGGTSPAIGSGDIRVTAQTVRNI
jgi:hypothetical protein